MVDFSPLALTALTVSLTPSFPCGTTVTCWLVGAGAVLKRDFARLIIQFPTCTSWALAATDDSNNDRIANATFLDILPPVHSNCAILNDTGGFRYVGHTGKTPGNVSK